MLPDRQAIRCSTRLFDMERGLATHPSSRRRIAQKGTESSCIFDREKRGVTQLHEMWSLIRRTLGLWLRTSHHRVEGEERLGNLCAREERGGDVLAITIEREPRERACASHCILRDPPQAADRNRFVADSDGISWQGHDCESLRIGGPALLRRAGCPSNFHEFPAPRLDVTDVSLSAAEHKVKRAAITEFISREQSEGRNVHLCLTRIPLLR